MTTEDCRRFHGDLAALALGRLEPNSDAEVALRAHLDGCPNCRMEQRDLESLARLLPLADLHHLDDEDSPSLDLPHRIAAQIERESIADLGLRRQSRRRRIAAGVAALAAAVVLTLGVAALLRPDSGPADRPSTREFAIAVPGAGGTYALAANSAGTTIDVTYRGLDPQERYWLWLTDATGKRVSAGTFWGADLAEPLVLQAALPLRDAARIWVTDAADNVILDASL
jgi:hypothetical protein